MAVDRTTRRVGGRRLDTVRRVLKSLLARIVPAVAALALLLAVPAAAADRGFHAETFILKNGLQVVVFPNHRAPIINHMIWYKVGSADEEKGKSGAAHFLEHLMFKGTPSIAPQEFSKIIARNGGRDNAFTSYDYTAYWQTIASDRLEMLIRMEADRMHNLVLTDALVDPERDVVLEERRMRTDNNPSAKLNEVTLAALFGPRGYGIPVIGYEDEIHKLTRQDEIAFYKAHYAPNNAILLVAGDVDPAKVRELAEKYFGPIEPVEVPPRTRPYSDKIAGPARVERRDPEVQQPQWSRDYLAPSYRAGDTKLAVPLQILAQVLGGNQTSRLYQTLVEQQKLAVDADADYSPTSLGQTTFGVSLTPASGVAMPVLEAAVDKEIARLLDKGITPQELAQAQARLIAANIYSRDTLGTGPRVYGAQLAIGRSIADIDRWPDEVQSVTVEQVNQAAHAVLKTDRAVTSLLLPAKAVGG
jgi:zinc protease